MINYKEAVRYIEGIPKFTKKHSISHTKEFLSNLGNPGKESKVLHVAGTNGKGSVCAYLQAILLAEQKETGLFTSPHLLTMNERIRVNGKPVIDDEFVDIFIRVKRVAEEMEAMGKGHPSYFEFLFGMAMTHFADMKVEYIILETGLGGRLDATNSIENPLLSIVTSVSLDHTEILGDTIEQIAAEKAGIIKAGVPVYCDGTDERVLRVIRKSAYDKDSMCREISKNAYEIKEITDKHIAFLRVNAYDEDIMWKLANPCVYQVMNAMLAIEAAECIFGRQAQKSVWKDALFHVSWEGRMEAVRPGVYIDGAHNIGAIEAFVESVRAMEKNRAYKSALPVILFSAVADKAYEHMIMTLCKELPAKTYVVTEIDDKRRVKAEELKRVFECCTDCKIIAKADVTEAWRAALKEKEPDGEVYCIGSLYLAGMIKELAGRR